MKHSTKLVMSIFVLYGGALTGCITDDASTLGMPCQTNAQCKAGVEICGLTSHVCETKIVESNPGSDPSTANPKHCNTSADCDYLKEKCIQSLCVANQDPQNPAPTLGQPCQTDTQCKPVVEICGRTSHVCETKVEKECYNDADCINHIGPKYICNTTTYTCEYQSDSADTAQLKFKAIYGAGAGLFSDTESWQAILGNTANNKTLVMMLCASDDENCKTPLKVIELGKENGFTSGVQNTVGSDILVGNLEKGDYNMMLFVDSEPSRQNGMDYKTPNGDEDWGGLISETDWALSAKDELQKKGYNPEPKALAITVTDELQDLGTLTLAHFHERPISLQPEKENGRIVVALSGGLRLIDLNTYELIPLNENKKTYDYQMINSSGEIISDSICGLIQSDNSTVWALYKSSKTDESGYAIPFDAINRKQIGNKRVTFPAIAAGSPCKGIAHKTDNGTFLFISNYPGPDNAKEGLWSAKIDDVVNDQEDVEANVYTSTDDPLFKAGAYSLGAYKDTLYMMPVPSDDTGKLKPCTKTNACAFKLTIQEDGKLNIEKTDDYPLINAGDPNIAVTTDGAQKLICNPNINKNPSMGVFGKWMFIGLCNEIYVHDLDSGHAVDFDEELPGNQRLASYLYGQYMHAFTIAPDGILWAMPSNKSLIHLYAKHKDSRVTYNRWAAMPIDLSGDKPKIVQDYAKADLDGYEGSIETGELKSPKIDPGLDLTAFSLSQYIISLYPSLQGSTPMMVVTGPKISVTKNTLWLSNTSVKDSGSNFGSFGDLAIYNLAEKQAFLLPHLQYENFYRVFSNGVTRKFGFPLDPNYVTTESFGTAYVNMDKPSIGESMN